jgi:uncharacterized protein (TIGR02246 family)
MSSRHADNGTYPVAPAAAVAVGCEHEGARAGRALQGVTAVDEGLVRSFAERYTAAWCSGDPAQVAHHYAPDGSLVINDGTPSVGRAEITVAAKSFMDTFPDLQVLLDEVRRGTDAVEYHWTLVGTHVETGNHVRVSGYELWELAGDVIQKSDGHFDQAEYDKQVAHGATHSS